jgi:molecular chaperone HscA
MTLKEHEMLIQLVEPQHLDEKTLNEEIPLAVGIDLGTTHSLIAYSKQGQPFVIKNKEGETLIPSVVGYEEETIIGTKALDLLHSGALSVFTSIKRLMGRNFEDLKQKGDDIVYPSAIETEESGIVRLKVKDKALTPIEISADILRHLKKLAERHFHAPVKHAVITVPAYFNEAARTATRDAARLAGLEVLRLLNEPTAAALAYGLDKNVEGIYAVYDLGGGTFDLSLLKLEKAIFKVLATGGDTYLGGDDFDQALLTFLLKGELPFDPQEYRKNLLTVRRAKEALSIKSEETVELTMNNKKHSRTLSRKDLEAAIAPFVARTIEICRRVLKDVHLTPQDIKGVILVGGATRMPYVVEEVERFFNSVPLKDIHPDEAVALGAALQAEALTKGSDTLLLDITPLSLGLETMGGVVERIITRNSRIPISKTQEFTTHLDGQAAMKLHIVQGEREMVQDCRSLAEFELHGIPPLPAGVARIEVCFTLDADGLLTVSASEKMTGISQHIEVKPSYGLSEEEIKEMIFSSYHHAEEDYSKKIWAETEIKALELLEKTKKTIKKNTVQLKTTEINTIQMKLLKVEETIKLKDRSRLEIVMKDLEETLQKSQAKGTERPSLKKSGSTTA